MENRQLSKEVLKLISEKIKKIDARSAHQKTLDTLNSIFKSGAAEYRKLQTEKIRLDRQINTYRKCLSDINTIICRMEEETK